MTRLMYRFAVSSKLAPALSLQSKMAYRSLYPLFSMKKALIPERKKPPDFRDQSA
jgi:hypothetical protein